MAAVDIDAGRVADLIKAGRPKEAEALYAEILVGLCTWEGLVLQDRIFALAGPFWPERASL